MIDQSAVRILDTTALAAYVTGSALVVAAQLVAAAQYRRTILVPAVCVAEAYGSTTSADTPLLDVCLGLPPIRVVPLDHADAVFVGGMSRFAGRPGLAHACLVALTQRIPVITTESAAAQATLGEPDLVWPLDPGPGEESAT